MSDPITPERLAQIKARAEAAAPGPWTGTPYHHGSTLVRSSNSFVEGCVGMVYDSANAQFVIMAREDIPVLLAEIERLEAEVEDLSNWVPE